MFLYPDFRIQWDFVFFLQVFLSGGQELMEEGLGIAIQTLAAVAG